MTQAPPIFFVHIPKTAGTSWRNAIARHEGVKLLCDYGPGSRLTSPELTAQAYGQGDARTLLDGLDNQRLVIAGHVGYDKYGHLTTQENTVTILRNPVERLISEYQHISRNDPESVPDFREFVEEDGQQNRQDKMIFGIQPQSAQVGLSSHYSDFLFLLGRRLGLDTEPRMDNRTPNDALASRAAMPVDAIIHAFSRSVRDLELVYETADIMRERLDAVGIATVPETPRSCMLELAPDGQLQGAVEVPGIATAFISLQVNGAHRAVTGLRQGENGMSHRTFRYPLALLAARSGDTVSAELLGAPSTRGSLKVP